jgi:diacylglycerol kinase family enzyme
MKFGVVINQHATGGRDSAIADTIRTSFATQGQQSLVRLCASEDLSDAAHDLISKRVDAVVAGGGDGTVSTIAEACARSGVPLGVLPLGTRNHFARDLGLPRGTSECIECITAGEVRRVDAGSVNGRIFINNSSIGAYPRAVEQREELRARFGLRKHVAGTIATLRTFARRPVMDAMIEIDGATEYRSSPFVFVGNNFYSVDLFSVRLRSSLSEGKLSVYTARCNGVPGLLKMLWLSLWNRLEQSRDFEMRCGSEIKIRLRQTSVRVSRDGEVSRLATPLHYKIEPAALQVFVPRL